MFLFGGSLKTEIDHDDLHSWLGSLALSLFYSADAIVVAVILTFALALTRAHTCYVVMLMDVCMLHMYYVCLRMFQN